VPGDLLRAPPLCQELTDGLAKLGVLLHATLVIACPAGRCLAMGLEGPITSLAAVAGQLTRDRRCGPPDLRGDFSNAQPCVVQVGNLDALILRQVTGADLAHRQPVQRRHAADNLPVPVDLVAARPVVSRCA
jgi:hypothetical protein